MFLHGALCTFSMMTMGGRLFNTKSIRAKKVSVPWEKEGGNVRERERGESVRRAGEGEREKSEERKRGRDREREREREKKKTDSHQEEDNKNERERKVLTLSSLKVRLFFVIQIREVHTCRSRDHYIDISWNFHSAAIGRGSFLLSEFAEKGERGEERGEREGVERKERKERGEAKRGKSERERV